jgi:undecaprenyl-diphosphatase
VLLLASGETARAAVLEVDALLIEGLRSPNDANDPLGSWWLTHIMVDITALGGRTVIGLITLIALGYLLAIKRRALAATLVATIGGGVIANMVLKAAFARERPDVVGHLVEAHSSSFPSAHAMNSAVAYLAIGAMLAYGQGRHAVRVYIMSAAIAITTLIGFSRVYLGVHWPSDVVVGWAVGACWVALCIRMVPVVRHVYRGAGIHVAAVSN